jgi:hypothetical protein
MIAGASRDTMVTTTAPNFPCTAAAAGARYYIYM